MKHFIFHITCFLILTSLNIKTSQSQWQTDVRLTNNNASSFTPNNNERCIASSGNTLHVVWTDTRGGFAQIFYKHSTDGGLNWGPDVQLTNDTWYFTGWPSITVSGSIVNIAWVYNHNALYELFGKRSTDGGNSWNSTTLPGINGHVYSPGMCGVDSTVFIVYQNELRKICSIRSTNVGFNYGNVIQLTSDSSNAYRTSIAISGSLVNLVWTDERDGNPEIYYKRSTDAGTTWGTDIRLTNNADTSWYSNVSASGALVHIVWQDNRDGNWEIYYKRSVDGGLNWGADNRLTNSPDSSLYPSVTSSGSIVHVVWQDHRDGNWQIYYKRSIDGGLNWGADTRLTNSPDNSLYPSISTSGSAVNVVWSDNRDGNYEIYYKTDPTGNPTGINPISSHVPVSYFLDQNYPNPFNPSTKIKFDIPANANSQTSNVRLAIYDITGREVSTLVNEPLKSGTYEVEWNANNNSSGVYFYTIAIENFRETKKMLLAK